MRCLADSHGSLAVGGRELGGGFRDVASGVPATGQCRAEGRREFLWSWLGVRTGSAQDVVADRGPGEQRGRERRPCGNGHGDREPGCHPGRVLEGGAGKPRGQGKGRDRDHLAEAREGVVDGGSDPGVPCIDARQNRRGDRGDQHGRDRPRIRSARAAPRGGTCRRGGSAPSAAVPPRPAQLRSSAGSAGRFAGRSPPMGWRGSAAAG